MKNFTIENDTNNITIHASAKEAEAVPNSERFSTEAALAADWHAARLVEIWNSLPGETPVKKFKDRATAVTRIWKAIQSLDVAQPVEADQLQAGTNTDQTLTDAPVEGNTGQIPSEMPSGDAAGQISTESLAAACSEAPAVEPQPEPETPTKATDVAPQSPDVAPEAAPAGKNATRAKKAPKGGTGGAPRPESKTAQVIAMLKREVGTTLEEIMTAMTWQKHTTRAMLSAGGSLSKNHGLIITSEKVGEKRVYSIKG